MAIVWSSTDLKSVWSELMHRNTDRNAQRPPEHQITTPAEKWALAHLKSLIASRQVSCVGHELDKYERLLAVCSTADTELNQEMVLQGWAISFGDYEREEAIARQNASGIWRGKFVSPDKWRRIDQKKHASGWLAKLFVW